MNKHNNINNGFKNLSYSFPKQRVSDTEKNKPKWYANCCDWVIAKGMAFRESQEVDTFYDILRGNIPTEFYKKTLNPYNSKNDKYTRFPATLRNYDMIKGIVRRYVSEYIKNPHIFTVTAKNPEIILAKNNKLAKELQKVVEGKIAERIQQSYQQYINEGGKPKEFNPAEAIDVESFVKKFNEDYIDDVSEQGQKILEVIQSITEDTLFYAKAYFDFICFGEVYTYADVEGNEFIKRNVKVLDAFPVPNDNMFVEDFDMFAERRKMTYQQIIDTYDEYLDSKQRKYLEEVYDRNSDSTTSNSKFYSIYEDYFPDVCGKFSKEDRDLFKKQNISVRDIASDTYDVWTAVWRGEKRIAIVTYVNEINLIDKREEDGDYKLNEKNGDISIEYKYESQVYESVRIGTRENAIYPYGARAVDYNRNGKLPYNGVCELLPNFGRFSVIEEVTPYQTFYNIVAYHREMAIAKHKLSILMIARSLLGKVPEKTIYKMLADGVLYIDDSVDEGMVKAQHIRMLNSSNGEHINNLTNLLETIKIDAKNQVDMTPQRYGEIANSAGKGVTQEAINRGSMGSVIIEYVMDSVRERDYARDMDYSKFAWVDGLNTAIKTENDEMRYISLDVDKHIHADYVISAKNSAKELDKLQQLKAYAFSAGQNGEHGMAMASIMGDNIASIKKLITKYENINREHELKIKESEQQVEKMKEEFELKKITHIEEEKRETIELEKYLEQEISLIKADSNMLTFDNDLSAESKTEAMNRLNDRRVAVDREKNRILRESNILNFKNKQEENAIKNKEIDTNYKIAKENKNKYDTKSNK